MFISPLPVTCAEWGFTRFAIRDSKIKKQRIGMRNGEMRSDIPSATGLAGIANRADPRIAVRDTEENMASRSGVSVVLVDEW